MAASSAGHVLVASCTTCSTGGGCHSQHATAGGAATAATLQSRDRHRRRHLRPHGGKDGRCMPRRLQHRAQPAVRSVRGFQPPRDARAATARTAPHGVCGQDPAGQHGLKPHVNRYAASREATARLASDQGHQHGGAGVPRPVRRLAPCAISCCIPAAAKLRRSPSPWRPSRRAPMQRAPAIFQAVGDARRGSPGSVAPRPGSGGASSATPSRPR